MGLEAASRLVSDLPFWLYVGLHGVLDCVLALFVAWTVLRVPTWLAERRLATLAKQAKPTAFQRALERIEPSGIPVFDEQGYYAGFLPKSVVRSRTAFRSPLYWQSPYRFRMMLEHLPIGHAHCRLTTTLPEGRDFVLLDANTATEMAFGEFPAPSETPASERWPALYRNHPEFFSKLARLRQTRTCTYTNWFPTIGKWLELRAVYLGDDHFSATIRDVTDDQTYRDEVLRLYEQLARLESELEAQRNVLTETTDDFVHQAAETLYAPYDTVDALVADTRLTPEVRKDVETAHAQLQFALDSLRQFAQVTALDFTPSLVNTAHIFGGLVEGLAHDFPHVTFRRGPAPLATAAEQALQTLMRKLLQLFCEHVAAQAGTTLEVGVRNERLSTVYYVYATRTDALELLPYPAGGLTFPGGPAALQLNVCRRLAYWHGGGLQLVRRGDFELEAAVTLGTPLASPMTDGLGRS